MSKKFTSLLVLVAAILLAVPAQAQIAKKAAKQQIAVLKTGPVKSVDLKKAKAAKMKAEAQLEGQAFTGKMFNYLQASLEKVQDDKDVLEKQMEENFRTLKNGNVASFRYNGATSSKGFVNPRYISFDAVKPSARRASNRAEVVDANGIITAIPEGDTKIYQRSGFGYYVSSQQLYYAAQQGNIEITELEDGTVYFKDFFSNVSVGTYVKGTKEGNKITIAGGQVVYFWTSYGYGLKTGLASYDETANKWISSADTVAVPFGK